MTIDAHPLMWSHCQLPGDTPSIKQELPHYYSGEHYWSYFHKEESWFSDSNFYQNPFMDPHPDGGQEDHETEWQVKPIRRSNSYDLLELDSDASDDDIKQAFRKKALETHPDKGGDPEQFRKVREAYECLIS